MKSRKKKTKKKVRARAPAPRFAICPHTRITTALKTLGYPAPELGRSSERAALCMIADALEDVGKRLSRKRRRP